MSEKRQAIVASLPPQGWITAQALASLLGCSLETVKRWAEKNNVTRLVIGGKWLLRIDDFSEVAKR